MLVIKRDKDQLINMIENETNIDNPNLYANLKIYILSAMNESEGINHVDINLKKQVATCMIEFINKSINKGYLNTDNYKDSLKRIIQSCEKFYDITDKTTYGNNSTSLASRLGVISKFTLPL